MVAPALIGGRGSQLIRKESKNSKKKSGARPHRRARIATSRPPRHCAPSPVAPALIGGRGSQLHQPPQQRHVARVAPALIGGRGSQRLLEPDAVRLVSGGGARPHRRARIATSRSTCTRCWMTRRGARPHRRARIATSGFRRTVSRPRRPVAPALIGGRGSQRANGRRDAQPQAHVWRSPSSAGEDRNHSGLSELQADVAGGARPHRRARIATLGTTGISAATLHGWRPPSSAGEDRNRICGFDEAVACQLVAPALIGGRGSQPRGCPVSRREQLCGARPHRRARIATVRRPPQGWGRPGGARPHRRARIATPACCSACGSSPPWRPPSSAGEDRNRVGSIAPLAGMDPWRPPSSAGEDRNRVGSIAPLAGMDPWRPPSSAGEDRNQRPALCPRDRARWRPPSSAGEDRNRVGSIAPLAGMDPWRPPSSAGEDRNQRPALCPRDRARWRPPSSAGEDRNR